MPQLWRHFITAVGQHKKDGQMGTPPCQGQQEFKAGVVAPVEIFNDEQQGLVRGLMGKKMEQQGKETAFLLLWISSGGDQEKCTVMNERCHRRQDLLEF